MAKKVLHSKYNECKHPEDVVCRKDRPPLFQDDESYLIRMLKSTIKGCAGIIQDIQSTWKGKDIPQVVSKDLLDVSSRKYEAQKQLDSITKKD
jgi:hypothetical protein